MNIGQRLIRLVRTIHLLQHTCYNKQELAKKFKVNVKTIQRDFIKIKQCGFQLVKLPHALYCIKGELPEIDHIKKQEDSIKQITENTFYGERTQKTATIRKTKGGKYFYFVKDKDNNIEYISPKYKEHYIAKRHLKLAL
jgi:hypothetical protein